MKLFKHFLIMALALTACAGFTSCKDDDDDEDSKRPLTGYWVSEDGEEFYYFHPNGCGFGGYLDGNPPKIYDIFESYVITKDDELIIYWLNTKKTKDFTTDPDNKGQVTFGKNTFTFEDYTYLKEGKEYPYALNFQVQNKGEEYVSLDEITKWWNEHTK